MTGFEPETSWCWKQLLCQLSITAPYNMIVTTSLRSHASHFCPVFSFPVKLVEMIVDICGRVIRPTDQKCRDVIVLDLTQAAGAVVDVARDLEEDLEKNITMTSTREGRTKIIEVALINFNQLTWVRISAALHNHSTRMQRNFYRSPISPNSESFSHGFINIFLMAFT